MALITMREALNQAMREEMRRDERVFLLGEEVGHYQGPYKITQGLLQEFGEWRVRDTPIAEEAIAGVAVGAAFIGLRPIAEMMTFNFSILALDMIVNHAAKYRYMSGGQMRCPMVMRGPSGAAAQVGGPALPGLRELVRPRSRPRRRHAVDAQGRQGAPEERHPGRQPGDLHGERGALQPQGRGARRGVHDSPRPGRRQTRRQGRDHRRVEPLRRLRPGRR